MSPWQNLSSSHDRLTQQNHTRISSYPPHCRLPQGDIHWWQTFLTSWNGRSFFHEDEWLANSALELFTDASHATFGAYFAGEWFSCSFSDHRVPFSRSITFKELSWCAKLFCWLPLSFAGDQVPPPLTNGQRASHVRSTCSFDQLHVNAMEYFRSDLADSTDRTYSAAQRQFLNQWTENSFLLFKSVVTMKAARNGRLRKNVTVQWFWITNEMPVGNLSNRLYFNVFHSDGFCENNRASLG